MKWLQGRLTVLGLVKTFVETNQQIKDAGKPTGGASAAVSAAPASVAVQPAGAFTMSANLPSEQKIYERDGVREADVVIAGQGVRTVRVGSVLPNGMKVVEITKEDVVVDVDTRHVPLPSNTGSPGGSAAPQPAAGLRQIEAPVGTAQRGSGANTALSTAQPNTYPLPGSQSATGSAQR
jgi:hypothetical protein